METRTSELKPDTAAVARACSDISYTVSSVKHEIFRLESHVHELTRSVRVNCAHDMVIDYAAFEPCGPTPRICRKCGYSE